MKIFLVSSLKPTATANYLLASLRDDGNDLLVCSDVVSPLADCVISGAVDVVSVCQSQNFEPDLVLFIEGGTMRLFPMGMEKLSCLTAWYGIDTHMDYLKHLKIGRLFDVTFVAQKEFVERLKQDGLQQAFWLPLAFAPELHPEKELERKYDVSYVGSDNADMHPVRHQLLNLIKEHFSKVWIGKADPRQMGHIYAESKVVFNKSVNNDVNMRYFEAMGAGAVLVTDRAVNNGVEDLFIAGKHFLEYEDEQSLKNLIQVVLEAPGEWARIGHAARQHILENHTYSHRAKVLLEQVIVCSKFAKPGPEDYFSAFVSLRIANEALQAAEACFDWKSAGAAQGFVASVIRCALKAVRAPVYTLEQLKLLLSALRK